VLNTSTKYVFCDLTCDILMAPSFFAEKNVTLTTSHDIFELFVVLEIDSSTIIIQNDDTAPHFDGIFREFHGEFLLLVACFSFLSCLDLE